MPQLLRFNAKQLHIEADIARTAVMQLQVGLKLIINQQRSFSLHSSVCSTCST